MKKDKIIINKNFKSIFVMEKKRNDEYDVCEKCKFEPVDNNPGAYCNFCMKTAFKGYRIKAVYKLSDNVEIM